MFFFFVSLHHLMWWVQQRYIIMQKYGPCKIRWCHNGRPKPSFELLLWPNICRSVCLALLKCDLLDLEMGTHHIYCIVSVVFFVVSRHLIDLNRTRPPIFITYYETNGRAHALKPSRERFLGSLLFLFAGTVKRSFILLFFSFVRFLDSRFSNDSESFKPFRFDLI